MQVEFLVCLVLAVVVVRSEILLGTPGLHFNQNAEYAASYDNYQPRDYAFDYAVSDPHTGDHKSQWEIKEKGVVRGSYSLLEPDGTTRIVEYVADDLGFRAVVKKIGHSLHPGGIAIQSVEAHGIPSAPAVVAAPVAVVHQPDVQTYSAYDGHVQNYANVAVQPIEIPQSVQYQAPVVAQQAAIYAQQVQAPVIAKVQPQLYQNVQPVIQEQVSYQAQPIQQAYAQSIQQAYAQPIQEAYAQPIQQAYAQPIQQAYAQPIQQAYAQPIQQSQVYAQPIQQSQVYAQPIQQSQVYAQPIVKQQVYQNIQAQQPIQQYVQAEPVLQERAYQNSVHAQPIYQNIEQYPQAVLAHAAQSTQNQQQLPSADYGLQSHHQQVVPVSQPRYVETSSQIHGLTGNLDDDSRYSNAGYEQNALLQQGGYELSIPIGDYQGGYGIESPRSYRNTVSKRSKSPQPFLIKA